MNNKVPVLLAMSFIAVFALFVAFAIVKQSATMPQDQVSVTKKAADTDLLVKLVPDVERDYIEASETKTGSETGKTLLSREYKELGVTVEVVKGNLVSNSCFDGEEFMYETILRIMHADGKIENVDTNQCSDFSFFALAPKGELLFFVKSGYESGSSHIWDRVNKKDILQDRNDVSIDSEKNIYWSADKNEFAVVSSFNPSDGSGTNGIFVGKTSGAVVLKPVFSFSDSKYILDSQILQVMFSDQNTLSFVAKYQTAEDEVEKEIKYRYSFATDKLEEVR